MCVKTMLETLVVNVICHEKMHMFVKFRRISMLVFYTGRKCSNVPPERF
jgi:hypothetical protein